MICIIVSYLNIYKAPSVDFEKTKQVSRRENKVEIIFTVRIDEQVVGDKELHKKEPANAKDWAIAVLVLFMIH